MKKIVLVFAILIATLSANSQVSNHCIGIGIGGPSYIVIGDTLVLYGYAYDNYTSNKTYTFQWSTGKTETATLTNLGKTALVWNTIIPTSQTTYTITASDSKGCINSVSTSPQFLIPDTTYITEYDSVKWVRLNHLDTVYNSTIVDYSRNDSVYYKKSGIYRKIYNDFTSPNIDLFSARILKLTIIDSNPIDTTNIDTTTYIDIIKENIIYPNPTSNHIYIGLDSPYTKIYDNLGKFVLDSHDTDIQLYFLPNGIYNVIVLSGNKQYHKQIMKK